MTDEEKIAEEVVRLSERCRLFNARARLAREVLAGEHDDWKPELHRQALSAGERALAALHGGALPTPAANRVDGRVVTTWTADDLAVAEDGSCVWPEHRPRLAGSAGCRITVDPESNVVWPPRKLDGASGPGVGLGHLKEASEETPAGGAADGQRLSFRWADDLLTQGALDWTSGSPLEEVLETLYGLLPTGGDVMRDCDCLALLDAATYVAGRALQLQAQVAALHAAVHQPAAELVAELRHSAEVHKTGDLAQTFRETEYEYGRGAAYADAADRVEAWAAPDAAPDTPTSGNLRAAVVALGSRFTAIAKKHSAVADTWAAAHVPSTQVHTEIGIATGYRTAAQHVEDVLTETRKAAFSPHQVPGLAVDRHFDPPLGFDPDDNGPPKAQTNEDWTSAAVAEHERKKEEESC